MVELLEKGRPQRLEDFLLLARKGKRIHLQVDLRKQMVSQKVQREVGLGESGEIYEDIALSLADYTFIVDNVTSKISKVYMYTSPETSEEAAQANDNIANARLRMDYLRLKDAGIPFEEKYF